MATTTISDFVIWAKQVHDDGDLAERIIELNAGETIDLIVDGVRGVWRKMDDGKDGRPTRGIRPLGRTQDFWRGLYEARRGDIVTLQLARDRDTSPRQAMLLSPPLGQTSDQRAAALEALLEMGRQGWRSDGPFGAREDLYVRS